MLFGCTFYMCYQLFVLNEQIVGKTCCVYDSFCANETNLPLPSEVVNLYETSQLSHKPDELQHRFVVRMLNSSTMLMKVFPIPEEEGAIMGYILQRHTTSNNGSEIDEYVTHKMCVMRKSYKMLTLNATSSSSPRFFQYNVNYVIIVLLSFILVILVGYSIAFIYGLCCANATRYASVQRESI